VPRVLRETWILLRKDALVEARSREVLASGLVFSLLVLLVFTFALDLRVENAAEVAPGALWVAVLLTGVLTLGRSFSRERDRGTLEGLLVAPIDRGALFLSKLVAAIVTMGVVEVVSVLAAIGLFNLRVDAPRLALGMALGTVGFAAVGTLFAAVSAHTRAREAMLPLLLFPIQVPVILATVKAIGAAIPLPGATAPDVGNWLGLLAAFDVLFLALGLLLFDYAIEED